MEKNDVYDAYRRDTHTLAELGAELQRQLGPVTVRLPRALAEAATASWNREDAEDDSAGTETYSEHRIRHNSGDLALIGLAVEEHGVWDGDSVTVTIDAGLAGRAASVADEVANGDY